MLASLVLVLWPTVVSDNCSLNEETKIVGIARNSNHQLIYCERVAHRGEEQLHLDYLLDQKIFAVKDVILNSSPEKPEILQQDFRTGETRRATVAEKAVRLSYKENSKALEKTAIIDIADVDVIDAGFNEFIRNHWVELSEKKYSPLKFGSIAHLKSLNLRIHQQRIDSCVASKNTKPTDTCFIVEIDNFLLRMLLGKMQLIYDEQHRLKNYLGPVNITNEKGDTQNASIDYYYDFDYLQK